MITHSFNYSKPGTLTEALELLAAGGKPLAGGMSLVPAMKLRLAAPEHLVDLGAITELNSIREEAGALHIGAMTTHYAIESSALVASRCPLLAKTAGQIGDVQIRNMGTIGGSIAHSDPAADWPAALLALEAVIQVTSRSGSREIAAEEFFVDVFTTALEEGELVTGIRVPVDPAGASSLYKKLHQPASGFAIVGVAAHVVRASGSIRCRLGITGLAGKAFRARETEAAIEAGKLPSEAVTAIVAGDETNSDIHASAEYRAHMARVYARRALEAVLA
jgi:carbon-monoxide dehydrogenase medium subunit